MNDFTPLNFGFTVHLPSAQDPSRHRDITVTSPLVRTRVTCQTRQAGLVSAIFTVVVKQRSSGHPVVTQWSPSSSSETRKILLVNHLSNIVHPRTPWHPGPLNNELHRRHIRLAQFVVVHFLRRSIQSPPIIQVKPGDGRVARSRCPVRTGKGCAGHRRRAPLLESRVPTPSPTPAAPRLNIVDATT